MSKRKIKSPIDELKILVCRECGAKIDDMGCVTGCKYDDGNPGGRDSETLEILVYVFDRVEPYSAPKSKKKKKIFISGS